MLGGGEGFGFGGEDGRDGGGVVGEVVEDVVTEDEMVAVEDEGGGEGRFGVGITAADVLFVD